MIVAQFLILAPFVTRNVFSPVPDPVSTPQLSPIFIFDLLTATSAILEMLTDRGKGDNVPATQVKCYGPQELCAGVGVRPSGRAVHHAP